MGGCRCCFRDCPVASERNKGMHFFRLPIKDQERFRRWTELIGWKDISNLTASKLWNKVICSRHFHDNNFMNYKCNRLTSSAIPTLHRLNEEYALDYSNDVDNPVLIKLPPTTRPHLIPPEGFKNTMQFIAADRILADRVMKDLKNPGPRITDVAIATKRRESYPIDVQKPKKPKLPGTEKSIADNCLIIVEEFQNDVISIESSSSSNDVLKLGTVLEIINSDEVTNQQMLTKSPAKNITDNSSMVQYVSDYVLSESRPKSLNLTSKISNEESLEYLKERLTIESKNLEKTTNELRESNKMISHLNESLEQAYKDNDQLEIELFSNEERNRDVRMELESVKLANKKLQREHNELEIKYTEMKKQKICIESKNLEETENELRKSNKMISHLNASLEQACKDNDQLEIQLSLNKERNKDVRKELESVKLTNEKLQQEYNELQIKYTEIEKLKKAHIMSSTLPIQQQQLSKLQLFNGIKKYLSQTMVALLRIQLTSNAEREWKPDERRVAVDLMELGEQVYRYFTDEWLIRLPPLRLVHLWRTEVGAVYDEDDI